MDNKVYYNQNKGRPPPANSFQTGAQGSAQPTVVVVSSIQQNLGIVPARTTCYLCNCEVVTVVYEEIRQVRGLSGQLSPAW